MWEEGRQRLAKVGGEPRPRGQKVHPLDRERGQGGVATVYMTHDLKHDRDAALKFSP